MDEEYKDDADCMTVRLEPDGNFSRILGGRVKDMKFSPDCRGCRGAEQIKKIACASN